MGGWGIDQPSDGLFTDFTPGISYMLLLRFFNKSKLHF